MQKAYTVITDVKEIEKLNNRLGKRFRAKMRYSENREITFPSGHFNNLVYFAGKSGEAIRAWSPLDYDGHHKNFILIGQPQSDEWIEIQVQLNFPADKYTRALAGAFLRDSHGKVWVAHRGKLTKGMGGLPMDKVLDEFGSRVITAKDKRVSCRLIPIAQLDDPELLDAVYAFAVEAREVATKLGQQKAEASSKKDATKHGKTARNAEVKKASTKAEIQLMKLQAYFDEFSGSGTTGGHAPGVRSVSHGAVVKALQAKLSLADEKSLKSQAIDLAIVANDNVRLYEVKTSAHTTDVYTGIGQLLIHGEAIRQILAKPVTRILVLPEPPNPAHRKHIEGKAETKILTYKKVRNSYSFKAL